MPREGKVMSAGLDSLFTAYSCELLEQYASHITDCLNRLSDEQIWRRGSDNQNAIGNLVLHLSGNIRQWIGFGVAGQRNERNRDAEFQARGGVSRIELIARIQAAVADANAIIAALGTETLSEETTIQNLRVSKLQAVYHVVEHCSGHTGQIIFATKQLTGSDLGYSRQFNQQSSSKP